MSLPQFQLKPTRIMKHPSVPLKTLYSFWNKSRKTPGALNTSKINQQYYIKLKTDERLKDWRQDYNEFQVSLVCTRLSFPIEWRHLWHFKSSFVKTTIDHICWSVAVAHTAGSYFKRLSEVCGLYFGWHIEILWGRFCNKPLK